MSEDEQNGRWETTPAELKDEVKKLRSALVMAVGRAGAHKSNYEAASKRHQLTDVGTVKHEWSEMHHILSSALSESTARTATD